MSAFIESKAGNNTSRPPDDKPDFLEISVVWRGSRTRRYEYFSPTTPHVVAYHLQWSAAFRACVKNVERTRLLVLVLEISRKIEDENDDEDEAQ